MKTHLIKLFNYDRFANDVLLNLIIEANEPQKPLQLMAHLITASDVWLRRCKGLSQQVANTWPDLPVMDCARLINENHEAWLNYLQTLGETDFDNIIVYKNFRGDAQQDALSDICMQVINHGTHTRAQIGQQLRLAGVQSLPVTDYSYYLRLTKSGN